MAWLAKRHKEDKLIPAAYPLFRDWAERWWRWRSCPYVNARLAYGFRISPLDVKTGRQLLEKHVLPTLGKKRLSAIKPADIEKLLLIKHDEGLSPQSVKYFWSMLNTMFKEAVRLKQRRDNPIAWVDRMKVGAAERGTCTDEEMRKLLDEATIATVWDGDEVIYTATLVGASSD
jgi:hypothetical protein